MVEYFAVVGAGAEVVETCVCVSLEVVGELLDVGDGGGGGGGFADEGGGAGAGVGVLWVWGCEGKAEDEGGKGYGVFHG